MGPVQMVYHGRYSEEFVGFTKSTIAASIEQSLHKQFDSGTEDLFSPPRNL